MNSAKKGNNAVCNALSYFSKKDYSIFIPLNTNDSGAIDLVVSKDGINLQRVQCKFTERLHPAMKTKYPDRQVYEVFLHRANTIHRHRNEYTSASFDLLFVSTPQANYLFDWHYLCSSRGKPPTTLQIGKKLSNFQVL